ncbi:MAG: hypothetical protein ACSHXF_09150 [Aquaticitalea sp.]
MKNELIKVWYRFANKAKYLQIRNEMRESKRKARLKPDLINKLKKISEVVDSKDELNFSHSGHLGDLIYALPLIQELSKTKKCHLYVNLGRIYDGKYFKHPSGNVMITERSYGMLETLLKAQPYLTTVKILKNETIDVDLDIFREFPFSTQFHSFRWYIHIIGKQLDMSLPYLKVSPHDTIKNKIVVVRTFRARNVFIDYSFLNNYNDLLFLGTKQEYDDIKQQVPNMEFYDVKDFMEMAQIIKACRFYISNQTFAYALAEGLKVNRLLEAYSEFPVVYPTSSNGYDFYFQHHFENYVSNLYEETKH